MKTYFLAGLLVISAANLNIAFAEVPANTSPITIHQEQIGDITVSLLSEGESSRNTDILISVTPEMIQKYIPTGTYTTGMNAILLQTPEGNILIDTGLGKNLFTNLSLLQVSPDSIQTVLLTHMHGDHIGGLVKDGKAAFPNATVYLSEKEKAFWTGKKPDEVLALYPGRVQTFTPEDLSSAKTELFPGITPIASYGHTPGHTSYLIENSQQKLMVWGDLTHVTPIQFPVPTAAVTYDTDPAQAIVTRQAFFSYLAQTNIPVAGMHRPMPGFGIVANDPESDGYILLPIEN